MAQSYSAVASRNIPANANANANANPINPETPTQQTTQPPPNPSKPSLRRTPSPSHIPRTHSPEQDVFILTLLTDSPHHKRMTALREKYFPAHLNKLQAHLTLFHALPGSKLSSDIIPVIQRVAESTAPFPVEAGRPFRLKKGVAVSVTKGCGGQQGQEVHAALVRPWREAGFLSEQDAGGCRLHYTVMNKVDNEEEIERAFGEIVKGWVPDRGTAEGLALWRYVKGYWRFQREFLFSGS